MASQISGKARRENVYGITVNRLSATLPQTSTQNLFQVTGGRVLVTTIVGTVQTAIGAVANATKLQSIQGSIVTDMCATVDVNAAASGTLFGITGNPTVAAFLGSSVPQTNEMILPASAFIRLNTAGSSGTGSMTWTLTYIPLDDGATVVAV